MAQNLITVDATRTISPRLWTPDSSSSPSTALITPFVQPEECSTIRDLISSVVVIPQNGLEPARNETIWTVSSGPANPQFSSCLPPRFMLSNSSSYATIATYNFPNYLGRPALCPLSWSTIGMSILNQNYWYQGKFPVTQARCCLSGHNITTSTGTVFSEFPYQDYTRIITDVWVACVSTITTTLLVTGTLLPARETTTALITSGVFMYPVLSLEWREEDTSSMSPRPPYVQIDGAPKDLGNTRKPAWNLVQFLAFGIPGMCFFCLILGVVIWWQVKKRQRRRAAREAEVAYELELRDRSGGERVGKVDSKAPTLNGDFSAPPVVR